MSNINFFIRYTSSKDILLIALQKGKVSVKISTSLEEYRLIEDCTTFIFRKK
jgi:hypothetical protein